MYEYELKLLLNEDEFFKLLSLASFKEFSVFQTNYFFDTENKLLSSIHYALRIREEEKKFFLTLKGPKQKSKIFSVRLEKEEKLDALKAQKMIKDGFLLSEYKEILSLKFLAESLNITDAFFSVFLVFNNERTTAFFLDSIKTVLDKTMYEDHLVSYELEMEGESEEDLLKKKSVLEQFFQKNKINWNIAKESKLKRVLNFIKTDMKEFL